MTKGFGTSVAVGIHTLFACSYSLTISGSPENQSNAAEPSKFSLNLFLIWAPSRSRIDIG
jgi:hypothetical protein